MTNRLLCAAVVATLPLVAFSCGHGATFQFDLNADDTDCQTGTLGMGNLKDNQLSVHEEAFLSGPSNVTARENLYHYTRAPHMAGTKEDYKLAVFTRDEMRKLGFASELDPVDVLLSYPVSRSLEMFDESGNLIYTAPLSEAVEPSDPTSDTPMRNLTFNGYSPSGCATGELVYANYGRPEDFDALAALGISVEGKVVITRYGECFRGLKAMNSERRGATAVLIYSDPADDGYSKGETYPNGPWRSETSVQRGSIQFNSLCAGDPKRAAGPETVEELCGYSEHELYPSIPVIPISYGDALPLLRALGGHVAPKNFQGALDIQYHTGPSKNHVKVETENDFVTAPIYNSITTIPGTLPEDQDRPIILGNHRDAWVFGAADPNSGSTAMIEVARGLAKAMAAGWKPKRTIYLCSWDGEEYGLLGSTAWGEKQRHRLRNAVAYLNVDVGVSGRTFAVASTPAMVSVIEQVIQHVNDPDTGKKVSELWNRQATTLGSGSDYAVFLDHLGIMSVDLFMHSPDYFSYGTYHSTFDSFEWVTGFADPTMEYHVTVAQIWGLLAMRMASDPVLSVNLVAQSSAVLQYVKQVSDLLDHSPIAEKPSLAMLKQKANEFHQAATKFHSEQVAEARHEAQISDTKLITGGPKVTGSLRHTAAMQESLAASKVEVVNDKLAFTERQFLHKDGLHKRKWFRHVLQSPGLYLGYAADVLPGITQAIRDKEVDVLKNEIVKVVECLDKAIKFLSS